METPEASAKAIRSIGTNALPFYLGKLRRPIGTLGVQTAKIARAAGFKGFLFEDAEPEREEAAAALILLKPLPPKVVSELAVLSTNRDPCIAGAALCALKAEEKELLFLQPPESRRSIDADLYRIPIPADSP